MLFIPLLGVYVAMYMGEPESYRLPAKLFQGLDSPCPFCTNACLSKDRFYTWKHYNEKLKTYFILRDKLVEIDGRDSWKMNPILSRRMTDKRLLFTFVTSSPSKKICPLVSTKKELLYCTGVVKERYQCEHGNYFAKPMPCHEFKKLLAKEGDAGENSVMDAMKYTAKAAE